MQILSSGQYDRMGCFDIPVPNGSRRNHYIAVFSASQKSREDIFSGATSDNSRRKLPLGEGGTISYTFKPLRNRWKFNAVSGYEISVSADRHLKVPMLLLVMFSGRRAPTGPSSGDVILRIPGMALGPERDFRKVLDTEKMGRHPFVVRLFFSDEDAYEQFEIDHPPPGSLAFT